MKIGIIGAGHIGGTLTRRLRAIGHDVEVANSQGPQSLFGLAKETGARPVAVEQAVRGKDVIIVTIPEKSVPELPANLFNDVSEDTVVIDTGNYYPRQRDGRIEAIESGVPESRWVEDQIGHPVVKVFNTIYAQHLLEKGKPRGTATRIALPISGDDPLAKSVVMRLADELGFDAVDAGPLDDSWRQQPGTPVYTADLDAEGVQKALTQARRERAPEWRAAA